MGLISKVVRYWLASSGTKEQLRSRMESLVPLYKKKYVPLRDLAAQGVEDVVQRLDFLRREADGRVVDIGCYDGFFAVEIARQGKEVVGVDMVDRCCRLAYRQSAGSIYPFHVVKAYSEGLPFRDGSFDTAILSHTLEHVFDPALSIKEAARVTRPGGKIITLVPPSLGNSPAHLRYVSVSSLREMMSPYTVSDREVKVGDGVGFVSVLR